MGFLIAKAIVVGATVVGVTELMNTVPRLGALLLSVPMVSVLVFCMSWISTKRVDVISNLSRDMLIFIPLTLVFYIPFLFMEKFQFNFWLVLIGAIFLTLIVVGGWYWLSAFFNNRF